MADRDVDIESADSSPASARHPQVSSGSPSAHVVEMSQAATPKNIAVFVNQEVFDQLKAKSDINTPEEIEEVLDEDDAKRHRGEGFATLSPHLGGAIKISYKKCSVSSAVVQEVAKSVANKTKEKFVVKNAIRKLSQEKLYQLMVAFTETKYVGDAQDKFEEYLWRCWKIYNPVKYKAPYVAVVQSSGFGKSRLLFELARKADYAGSKMKVLYTCVRLHESTGYPEVTKSLRDWLFPTEYTTADAMASRLVMVYDYAKANWNNVQTKWSKLFTDTAVDVSEMKNLEKVKMRAARSPKAGAPIMKNPDGKMVVLVVDEARTLLTEGKSSINNFRMLRHALASANNQIGAEGGVFGVLIDTNSKISDLTPPLSLDPSSRNFEGVELASFPPFVLTHTMDVNWREYCQQVNLKAAGRDDEEKKDEVNHVTEAAKVSEQKQNKMSDEIAMYKAVVTGGASQAWDALMRMGRPMWWITFTASAPRKPEQNVVTLAANKLLLGQNPGDNTYNKNTMFGVASMLCRLGVRPYSTSALASRAVADFMAILAYVNYEKEGYLSSYASDPVLALGAMKVWYALDEALPIYILPQLKKLILDEALDTGGVGEMVARILLLLAMDKCAIGGKPFAEGNFTGQFVLVKDFLEELEGRKEGGELTIFRKGMYPMNKERSAFRTWQSQWEGWKMGFTHFVQLQLQPNEDTLWYLLGRRAAGIFPRNQKGADLLIPIFWKKPADDSDMETDDKVMEVEEKVSLMLIQVKSRSPVDGGFFRSATEKLCPWFVFENPTATKEPADNPLGNRSVHEVIRIYMSLRDQAVRSRDHECYKFIYSTPTIDNTRKPRKPKKTKAKRGMKPNEGSPSNSSKAQGVPANDDVQIDGPNASRKASKKRKISSKGNEGTRSTTEGAELEDSNAVTQGSNATSEANNVFTYCFRSLGCKTYPFLTDQVAKSLASIVEPLWDPIALVDGDLEHRRKVEESFKGDKFKAIQSKAMPDDDLKGIACQGVAYAPGQVAPTDIARFVNQKVFDELPAKQAKEVLDEAGAKQHRDEGFVKLRSSLRRAIKKKYSVTTAIAKQVAKIVANETEKEFAMIF